MLGHVDRGKLPSRDLPHSHSDWDLGPCQQKHPKRDTTNPRLYQEGHLAGVGRIMATHRDFGGVYYELDRLKPYIWPFSRGRTAVRDGRLGSYLNVLYLSNLLKTETAAECTQCVVRSPKGCSTAVPKVHEHFQYRTSL